MHTCKLLQAKNYQRTLIPIKYRQPLPTHPLPKVQLYMVVKCGNIYRVTKKKKESHTQFMFCCFHSNQYGHCQEMSPTKRAGGKRCMKDSLSCIFGYILDMVLLWGFISFGANYCIHFNLGVTLIMQSKIRKNIKRCQGWGWGVFSAGLQSNHDFS